MSCGARVRPSLAGIRCASCPSRRCVDAVGAATRWPHAGDLPADRRVTTGHLHGEVLVCRVGRLARVHLRRSRGVCRSVCFADISPVCRCSVRDCSDVSGRVCGGGENVLTRSRRSDPSHRAAIGASTRRCSRAAPDEAECVRLRHRRRRTRHRIVKVRSRLDATAQGVDE